MKFLHVAIVIVVLYVLYRLRNRKKATPVTTPKQAVVREPRSSVAETQAATSPVSPVVPEEESGFEEAAATKLKNYLSYIRENQISPAAKDVVPGIAYDEGTTMSEATGVMLNSEIAHTTNEASDLNVQVATVMAYQEYIKLKQTAKGQKMLEGFKV